MLKDLLNKEVVITYAIGYSYASKKGVITKVSTKFVIIDDEVYLAIDRIVKVVIKEKKKQTIS